MKKQTVWLYPLLFLAFFDLHAQHPILPAFAYSVGASAAMIGVILSGYSAASMTGNIVAGPLIDRFGGKVFIVLSLCLAGFLLFIQGLVTNPAQLFGIRVVTGLILAFLSPACFALLGKQGHSLEEQGHIMAKNGMMITLASLVSPLVGGFLADTLGYTHTFWILGAVLIFGGWVGKLTLVNDRRAHHPAEQRERGDAALSVVRVIVNPAFLPAYIAAFTTSLGQGILMYEVPYVLIQQGESTTETGLLLTLMGLGSLVTLSQGWLNRFSPYSRCFIALAMIAALFYVFALRLPVSLGLLLFVKGMAHGLMFPAKTTILTGAANPRDYGKAFGVHSAVLSSGFVIGPLVAGTLRDVVSPFFVAFIVTMVMILTFIVLTGKRHVAPVAWRA